MSETAPYSGLRYKDKPPDLEPRLTREKVFVREPEPPAEPKTEVIVGRRGGGGGSAILAGFWASAGAGATRYLTNYNSTEENRTQKPMPFDATLKNLFAISNGSPGAGETFIFMVRVEGADTVVTCTIADAETEKADTTNEVSVSKGDKVTVRCVTSAGATAGRYLNYSLEIEKV